MKVYIAQLKCPNNHCVIAAAEEYGSVEEARALISGVEKKFRDLVKHGVNNHCGVCGSNVLHVELAPTTFRSMQETTPYLVKKQQEQIEIAMFLKASRKASRN
jgi:hypothetical protein